MSELTAPRPERRKRRTRRQPLHLRRWSDVGMVLIKLIGPLVAVLWGYDFVQVDNDNYTMRRVHTERQSADARVRELSEKLDALLQERDANRVTMPRPITTPEEHAIR